MNCLSVGCLKLASIVTVARQYLNLPQNGRVLSSMFHSYSFGNTELEYGMLQLWALGFPNHLVTLILLMSNYYVWDTLFHI